MKITLTDEHDQDFIIELSEEQILHEEDVYMIGKSCFLPFYNNKLELNGIWRLGSIVMNKYYTVFDMTPEDGSLAVGIALKNPVFVPDTDKTPDDGGITPKPEEPQNHTEAIGAVVIILILVILIGACIYKKKRDRELNPITVFETYKEYKDFGDMKLNKAGADKKGINYSESKLDSNTNSVSGREYSRANLSMN